MPEVEEKVENTSRNTEIRRMLKKKRENEREILSRSECVNGRLFVTMFNAITVTIISIILYPCINVIYEGVFVLG